MKETTKGLQLHEVRVVNERTELIDKINKLHSFIDSAFYNTLNEVAKKDMEEQECIMIAYSDILSARIDSFEGSIENTTSPLTIGRQAVGLIFNTSDEDRVGKARQLMADAIDLLEQDHTEKTFNNSFTWIRSVLRTAAFNAIITAQMAIVKYITWKD